MLNSIRNALGYRGTGNPRDPGSPNTAKMPMQPIQPAPPASMTPAPAATTFQLPAPVHLGELKQGHDLQSVSEAIHVAQATGHLPASSPGKVTPGEKTENISSVAAALNTAEAV